MAPQKLFQLVLIAGRTGFWQFRISEELGMGTGPGLPSPLLGSLFPHRCPPSNSKVWGRRARWVLRRGKWLPLPRRLLPEAKWAGKPLSFSPVKVPGQAGTEG